MAESELSDMSAETEDNASVQSSPPSLRYGHYYIRGYLQGAVDQGLDPYCILEKAGISPTVYDDPGATLDGEQMLSLLKTVMDTLDDVYLGFLAEPGKKSMQLQIDRVTVNSETLRDAIDNLLQFHTAIRNDMVRYYGSDARSHEFFMELIYKGLKPNRDKHLFYFYRLALNYRGLCWFIGKRIKLSEVSFSTANPRAGIDYQKYFNCKIQFNQKVDGFRFDSKYLAFPVVRTESEISYEDAGNPYSDWNSQPGEDSNVNRQIERMLAGCYEKNHYFPSMEQVAESLHMTPRTLARRLAFEGASFREIKLAIKQKWAEKLVQQTELPIAQIAEKLGFNHPGHFTRYFLDRTGSTPTDYRKKYQS